MSTFNATSGAIDALFGIGIYALVVFGLRSFVHGRRGTEPNSANNKWLWLSVLGLAATDFVAGGSAQSTTSDASTAGSDNRCNGISLATAGYDDKVDAAKSVTERNYVVLQASYYVVNNASCFSATDVAAAQAFIARSK